MLQRDDDEHPIPEFLHGMLRQIAEAFSTGDFRLGIHPVEGVLPVRDTVAEAISQNVAAFGDRLVPLDTATWESSCYRWMGSYWLMLVDLSTSREPVSDLTLHLRMDDSPVRICEVQSVHVA